MNNISLMEISLMVRNLTISPSINNPVVRRKVLQILWTRRKYLCTLLFSIVAGIQRVYIPYSVIFSHQFKMTLDVERLQLTGIIRCSLRYTAVFLPPSIIYKLSLRLFIFFNGFLFIHWSTVQNKLDHILAVSVLRSMMHIFVSS